MNNTTMSKNLRELKDPKFRINGAEGAQVNTEVADNVACEILVGHSSYIPKQETSETPS